jgi:MFS superfamily sulfate permease-like transporter
MSGFILGLSIGIIIEQTHTLLGLPSVSGSYVQELWGTIEKLPDTSAATLAVGAICLGLLLLMRFTLPRWPRALIVMALAIVVVDSFDLDQHGVVTTGRVSTGLFSIGAPGIGWSDVDSLLVGALSVIVVGYSESLAAARSMSSKHGYEIDPNQELIAQGMSCGTAGLLGGFPVDGSLSKTSVADTAGQRSQMASLINALFVLLTILLLASLFEKLPSATLAAVVIDAMIGLVTFGQLRRYYRVNRWDWLFFMGAMGGILFFGIIQGIAIGVVLSLLLLIARSSQTSVRRVGREPESGVYHDVEDRDGLVITPGVLVARVDGPLFFADADRFRTRVRELVQSVGDLTAVVVDAESVHLSDTDGADIITQVAGELRTKDTALVLARVHPEVLELWRRAGVIDAIGDDAVFESVDEAVQTLAERTKNPAGPKGAGA